MGLIICSTHGESGFSMRFSKKVIDKINSDQPIQDDELTIFKIIIIDDEDGEVLDSESYLLLSSEFLSMDFPEVVSADSECSYDSYYSKLPELEGICFDCLQDYKKKHNLRLLDFN